MKKITLEKLAIMIQNGFEETAKKFEEVVKKTDLEEFIKDVRRS